jgi:acetyl-CoA carboxylase carboxyltransferase component
MTLLAPRLSPGAMQRAAVPRGRMSRISATPGSFIEYGALTVAAQRSRRPMEELLRTTPADGLITGLGTVNASRFGEGRGACAVVAYDYTVLAGTQGTMNHKKQDRLYRLAAQLRRPVVLFAEGGGGRPGDTDKEYVGVSGGDLPTWFLFGGLSGLVPLIGIVHGRCVRQGGTIRPALRCPVAMQVPNGVIDVVPKPPPSIIAGPPMQHGLGARDR